MADGREGGHRAIGACLFQRANQGTVAAHGMAADGFNAGQERQVGFDQRRQFSRDVVVHLIMCSPRRLRCIDIKSRALTQIVARRVVGNAGPARAGIRHHQRQAEVCGIALRAGLGAHIVIGAGETR